MLILGNGYIIVYFYQTDKPLFPDFHRFCIHFLCYFSYDDTRVKRKHRKAAIFRRKMSGGQKAVHSCMIRLLNLGPAKHEKVAIYVVNQRISNVCRITGAAS